MVKLCYALHFTLYTSVFANIYPINTLLAKIIGSKEQEKKYSNKEWLKNVYVV